MRRGTWAVVVVSGLFVLGACGGDDDGGGTGDGGSSAAGQGSSNGGSGGNSGSSGKGSGGTTGTGTGTNAGKGGSAGGSAGSSAAGSGAAGSADSDPKCDLECAPNQRCELVEVQCIRAPCPAQPTCVDGSTSGGSGAAGSGAAGSSGGSGKACGSRGLGQCADGEFCEFPMGADCGRADAPGKCAEQPTICTREYNPVCGCDGTTYSNPCEARAAGVSVETEGACGGMSSAGGTRCVGEVTCPQAMPPKCPDLQVHSIVNGCYGPCVSIDECQCSGPSDCPDENQYTCFMSAKHCGPYV